VIDFGSEIYRPLRLVADSLKVRRKGDGMRCQAVTVRAQNFLLVLTAAAAAVGFGSDRSQSEPLEKLSIVRPASAFDRAIGTHLRNAKMHTASLKAGTQVATAMRRLDLSKLTMADFGDVEPAR
jgi:hypothetical protein